MCAKLNRARARTTALRGNKGRTEIGELVVFVEMTWLISDPLSGYRRVPVLQAEIYLTPINLIDIFVPALAEPNRHV